MKYNFLIIHGTEGSHQGNWFPWIRKELEDLGHNVICPQFPTPKNQSFENWRKIAEECLVGLNPENTILIGHSIGAIFALRLAELTMKPYRAIFAICPFAANLGLAGYDNLNASFVHHSMDWHKMNAGAKNIFLFAGENDPYVPLRYSEEVAKPLGKELVIIKNGGHLNGESSFYRFPELLRRIKELSVQKISALKS